MATARVLNEKADVRKAVSADDAGVLRKFPPRASPGAKAMAWTAPSIFPHRSVEIVHDSRHVLLVRDVHLEHRHRLRQPLDGPLGQAQPAPEVGHHHLGAFLLGNPGDMEGNRVVRGDPGDQQFLSLEQQFVSFQRPLLEGAGFRSSGRTS